MGAAPSARALMQLEQRHGFDCLVARGPIPPHVAARVDFFENGVKVVSRKLHVFASTSLRWATPSRVNRVGGIWFLGAAELRIHCRPAAQQRPCAAGRFGIGGRSVADEWVSGLFCQSE